MTSVNEQALLASLETSLALKEVKDRPLVLALSGGVDSVALLHLLVQVSAERPIDLRAVHVHHGLSPNADAWSSHVMTLCSKFNVPLTICRVTLESKPRVSIEQQAREARYLAIAEQASAGAVVLTAHHRGDQAETLLLRLMRGAGLTGLSGIRTLSSYPYALGRDKALRLLRPLLSMSKEALTEYAQNQNLNWVEDESNQNDAFDRNFVRNRVLPLLSERWSSAQISIGQSAELLNEEAWLLHTYLQDDLTRLTIEGFLGHRCLDLIQLQRLNKTKQKALLRLFVCDRVGQYPSQNNLEQLIAQMLSAEPDRQPQVHLGQHTVRRHAGKLYIEPKWRGELQQIALQTGKTMALSHPLYRNVTIEFDDHRLKSQIAKADFSVRFGQLSARIRQVESGYSKPVKQVLKEIGCPAWYRGAIPLVFRGDRLVAIADFAMDAEFKTMLRVKLDVRSDG